MPMEAGPILSLGAPLAGAERATPGVPAEPGAAGSRPSGPGHRHHAPSRSRSVRPAEPGTSGRRAALGSRAGGGRRRLRRRSPGRRGRAAASAPSARPPGGAGGELPEPAPTLPLVGGSARAAPTLAVLPGLQAAAGAEGGADHAGGPREPLASRGQLRRRQKGTKSAAGGDRDLDAEVEGAGFASRPKRPPATTCMRTASRLRGGCSALGACGSRPGVPRGRPGEARASVPPESITPVAAVLGRSQIRCRDRLGGLLRCYHRAAWDRARNDFRTLRAEEVGSGGRLMDRAGCALVVWLSAS
jgi:hypothetical protein